MSVSGIVEWMQRTVKGTCQGCKNLEEGVLAIAMALTRRVLPQSVKMFLENRVVKLGRLQGSSRRLDGREAERKLFQTVR